MTNLNLHLQHTVHHDNKIISYKGFIQGLLMTCHKILLKLQHLIIAKKECDRKFVIPKLFTVGYVPIHLAWKFSVQMQTTVTCITVQLQLSVCLCNMDRCYRGIIMSHK